MSSGTGDVGSNLSTAAKLLEEAADGGADLAVLPEVFPYYGGHSEARSIAGPVPGPLTEPARTVARSRGIWVLAGSVQERGDDRVFNTSALFDRTGELVATYRKIHLFDVELEGQPPIRESALYSAGDQVVTAEVDGVRFGLSICYDLRFPELYRSLMVSGSTVLLVPSAFTQATGEAHWEVLLRARAIEDQCYVVAAAQWGAWGSPEDGRRCFGHSMVVDPWGKVVVEAPGDGDGVWFAEVDPDLVRTVRTRLPALEHRRLGSVC